MDLFEVFDTDYETEVKELERDIPKFAKAYYEGKALISDMEFDQLVDRLRELKPESKILSTPGWGYKQTGHKVKHKYQLVKSLDKCRTFKELPERFVNKEVMLSPKLDGLTGVFYYKNGKLIQAITRGNGQEGKDITDKALIIEGAEIDDKNFTGAVRGELEISKTNWNKVKDKYPEAKNARNLCAGWINSKDYDIEDIKLIDFVTYKVNGQERPKDMEDIFYELEGKNEFPHSICYNSDPLKSDVIYWLNYNFKHCIPSIVSTLREGNFIDSMHDVFDYLTNPTKTGYVDYELDGVVISAKDVIYHKSDYSYIYDECAFKFAAEEKETTINNIKWELSRTQRYVPVLEIEPVELSGATVNNVTGNNAKYLLDNGLGIGATISVCRSGEVIPKHMDTLEAADVDLPEKCPSCGHTLVWDGVDLKCASKDCPNIEYSDLRQWCETIGETDGMAWTLMAQYLYMFRITSIADLYDLGTQERVKGWISRGNLSITDKKAVEFFEKLYIDNIDVEKALIALNIPRLGDKTAKDLAKETDTIKQLIKDKETSLYISEIAHSKLLEVVKEATTKSIMENHTTKLKNILYIKNRIKYKETINKEIIKVAVTGALNTMKRSAFEKYIESYGYELSSAIKSCKYLITNTPDSGSSKNKDAQKYGVEIITEQAFLDLIGGNMQENKLF